ncbi:MAG: fatty acid desaturase [Deltaproteobacteria bacterium]|nr:fatty acid desaturase [Deltaproteobacteria bacterium]
MSLWKHSRWDAVLFAATLLQFALTIAWAAAFDAMSAAEHIAAFIPMVLLFYYNPIVVTHNFLHTPFFASNKLNNAFAIFNSANLGLPQILYKYHHLTHHKYSNDPIENGTTQDPSSTYRFGKDGRQEHWVPYSAFGLFRDGTKYAFREIQKKKKTHLMGYELISVALAFALLIALSWQWFLVVYAPLYLAGWFLAHVENYFEHFNATNARDDAANSVSYYHPLYNKLMFNEGYHQEHHLRPQRHWTERPQVQTEFRDEMARAQTHAASWPPLLGFLD